MLFLAGINFKLIEIYVCMYVKSAMCARRSGINVLHFSHFQFCFINTINANANTNANIYEFIRINVQVWSESEEKKKRKKERCKRDFFSNYGLVRLVFLQILISFKLCSKLQSLTCSNLLWIWIKWFSDFYSNA